MADKVDAFINHGEWKVFCPKCGSATTVGLSMNKYICLSCWPGIMAYDDVFVEEIKYGVVQKVLKHIPNVAMRQAASVAARQAGEEYHIDFPQHAQEIYDSIATEPDVNWRNWYPNTPEVKAKTHGNAYGQTFAQIQAERNGHPVHPGGVTNGIR